MLLIVLMTAATGAHADAPTILVLGDSLSAGYGLEQNQGWATLMQQQLRADNFPQRIVNSSISGDTTRGGLERLPAELTRVQPSIVIVELGANDGLRGLSLKEMRDNLAQIVALSRHAKARVLLVGMQLPPNYGAAYTRAFAAVYATLAQELNVPLVPFLLEGIAEDKQAFQSDGLHPTAASQPRLRDNIWPHLKPLLR